MPLHSSLTGDDLHPPQGKHPDYLQLDEGRTEAYKIHSSTAGEWLVVDTSNGILELLPIGGTKTLYQHGTGAFWTEGYHRFDVQGSDPSTPSGGAATFSKDVSSQGVFHTKSEDNTVTQLGRISTDKIDVSTLYTQVAGVAETAWSVSSLGANRSGWIYVIGNTWDGTDAAQYVKTARWETDGSSNVTVGTVGSVVADDEDQAGWDLTIDASTSTLRVRSTSSAGAKWVLDISYRNQSA